MYGRGFRVQGSGQSYQSVVGSCQRGGNGGRAWGELNFRARAWRSGQCGWRRRRRRAGKRTRRTMVREGGAGGGGVELSGEGVAVGSVRLAAAAAEGGEA